MPLKAGLTRTRHHTATVERLRNGISPRQMQLLTAAMRGMEGKPYDALFQWDDRAIYCSEFIYKAFDRGLGIKLGTLEHFRDLPLDNPDVKRLILQRYVRKGIEFNREETTITPAAIAEDPQLEKVVALRSR